MRAEMEAEVRRLRTLIESERGIVPTWKEGAERLTGAADKLDRKVGVCPFFMCMYVLCLEAPSLFECQPTFCFFVGGEAG
jgi:hypothetical protein